MTLRTQCPACKATWPTKLKAFRRWVKSVAWCSACAAELARRIAAIERADAQFLVEREARFEATKVKLAAMTPEERERMRQEAAAMFR